jgi:hypothetical protein
LLGVACLSTTACTAVGYYMGLSSGDGLAEQWDGSRWFVPINWPITPSSGADLATVSCTASSVCTAVGHTNASGPGTALIERYS